MGWAIDRQGLCIQIELSGADGPLQTLRSHLPSHLETHTPFKMRLARAALRQISRPLQASIRPLPGRTWNRSYATTISAAELEFGQPVHETHPHILKAGEGVSPTPSTLTLETHPS